MHLKQLASKASFVALLFAPALASAQSVCKINGQEVPCDQLGPAAAGAVAFGIGFMLFFGVLGILSTIFWIWMIIHAAKHDIENRAMWIVIMVFTGVLGAVIYYFAVARNMKTVSAMPSMASQMAQPMAAVPPQPQAMPMPTNEPVKPAEPPPQPPTAPQA